MNKSTIQTTKYLVWLFLLFTGLKTNAQVSAYSFSQSGGSYTEITGGTVVATATGTSGAASLDDVIYNLPAGTIPFSFTFDNVAYTGCNISSNGFITFGATAPAASGTTTGYVPLSATTAYAGAISALGRNLNAYFFSGNAAQTGQIRYQTLGSSPNRTFVVQFKNFKTFNTSGTTFGPVLNFQIRLSEGTNSISVAYNFSGAFALSTAQVGLRGPTNGFPTNLNNRSVISSINTWLTSSAGTSNTATCEFSGSLLPPSGLTYVWAPSSCPAPQNASATNITQSSAQIIWTSTGGNGTFSIEYGLSGFTQGTGTIINNAQSGASISGLLSTTNYQFYVRQVCGVNGSSAWVGPVNFSTGGPGEDCATATLISVANGQAACSFTTVNSGVSSNGPGSICSDANGNTANDDKWYRFTAPTNGQQIIITTTAGSVSDWVMEVWSACPGSGQLIKCSDDVNGFMPEISLCQNEYNPGQTYYIRIWTYSTTATGTCNLCVYRKTACPLAPVNDECVSATRLTVNPPLACPSAGASFSTANATPNTDGATCDAGTKRDVWFVFNTGNLGDIRMTISPGTATSLKAQLIFECGGFEISCYSPANGNYTFTNLNPQADYIIRVWSDSGAAGTFTICLSDICANPTAAWGGNQTACSGQATSLPVNFTGVPPYTFSYRNNSTNQTFNVTTSLNPYSLPLTLSATTTFTLLSMNDAACSGTASGTATVNVVNSQSVSLLPFSGVCAGAPSQVLSGGSPAGGVYSGTGVSNGVFAPSVGTQTITYTVTFAPGCTGSASQQFTVNPIPTVTLNTFPNVCNTAAPFTLTGGSPTGGTYTGTGVSNNVFNPSTAGLGVKIITYTFTSTAGCTNSDTATITVITCSSCTNPPTANAGLDRSTCAGLNVSLTGTIGGGATSATWSTQGTGVFSPNNTSLTAQYIPSAADISAGQVNLTLTTNDPDGTGPCVAASDVLVITFLPAASVSTITGSASVCRPATSVVYSVTNQSGYTYNWSVPTGVTITSGQGTNSITTSWSSSAASGNVSVAATNSCGTANRSLSITVSAAPSTPVISGPSQACRPQTGLVYSIPAVSGVTYSWTVPTGVTITGGAGTNSITTSWSSTAASGNVSVVITNSCGNATDDLLVSALSSPATPVISGSAQVCQGASGIVYSTSAQSGAGYNWTVPTGVTITSGQGTNSITTTWSGSASGGAISVSVSNSCGNVTANFNVTTLALPTIPVISGVSSVCPGATGVTFSIPAQTGVTYNWTVPSGVTITAGQGTTSISTSWPAGAASGNVAVSLTNSCGSVSATRAVTVSGSPAASSITGPATTCTGVSGIVFSVPAQTGASYSWTVPGGVTITAGQGTNSITTTWGSSAVSGPVRVTITNSCGSTSASLNVTVNTGLNIGSISGQSPLCRPATGIIYSVNNVAGTTYTWTVPSNVTITAGQGTSSITTSWSSSAVTGTITVNATGTCGTTSANRSITVRTAVPGTPGTVSGPSSACPGDVATFTIARVSTADYYIWTPPPGSTINGSSSPFNTPDTFVVVTFQASYLSDSLRVRSGNCAGLSTSTRTKAIARRTTVPSTPGTLTGQSSGLCGVTSVTYAMPSVVSGAISYTWRIKLTGALINGQPSPLTIPANQLSVVITYPNGWNGVDTIFVRANNGCGSSTERSLRVITRPGQPGVITGPTTVCVSATNQSYNCGTTVGTTSYTWTIPSGITLASGQGTSTVALNFNATAATRTISVVANNACGAGTSRTLSVTSQACPRLADEGSLTYLQLFPNPVSDNLNVRFSASNSEHIRISVTDISGRIVFTEERTVNEGPNALNLNLSGLSSGAYLLSLQSSEGTLKSRLIIER